MIPEAPVLDEQAVSLLRRLVGPDRPHFLRETVDTYLRDAEETAIALERALRGDDSPEVADAAHRLKGASAMVGAARVANVAEALQIAANVSEVSAYAGLFGRLEEELERERSALCALISEDHDATRAHPRTKAGDP